MQEESKKRNSSKYLILGGGMVAGYASKELVKLGMKPGELMIVSADEDLPYERPPLSKGFLAGKDTEESTFINSAKFYNEQGIQLKMRTTVANIDLKGRMLRSSSGEEFSFHNLLLATGARARRLDLPGSNLANIFYLRSMADSRNIRSRAAGAKRAVVIGGGFIGMEVASVLAQKNIDTTVVMPENRMLSRIFTPELSVFFERYYTERGVKLIKQASVATFEGEGTVRSVALADGRKVTCDLAVVGVGAVPATEAFANSRIAMDDGVIVNEYLETNCPDICAAGDIANYPDLIFGKRRRVEHWDNAVSQGQHWAQVMLGERKPFHHTPYFFSDVFDLSYELWGDATGADQSIVRGDLNTPSFSVWWLENKRLVAAFTMNRPDDERNVAPEWIKAKQTVSPELLRNNNRGIQEASVS